MHQAQTDRHPEKADKVGEQWLRLGLYYSQAHGIGTYSHHKYRGLWMLSYLVWDMMFTFLNVTFKTLQNDPVGHMKIVCTHARSLKHKRETNTGTHLCIHSSKIGRMLKSQSCTPTVWIKCSTWFTGFMHFLRKTWFAEITPTKKNLQMKSQWSHPFLYAFINKIKTTPNMPLENIWSRTLIVHTGCQNLHSKRQGSEMSQYSSTKQGQCMYVWWLHFLWTWPSGQASTRTNGLILILCTSRKPLVS